MGSWRGHPGGHRLRVGARVPQHDCSVQSVWLSSRRRGVAPAYPHRYIQMSGMVLGGMIEADSRLRQYEHQIRMQKRLLREQAKWDRYEEEFVNSKK